MIKVPDDSQDQKIVTAAAKGLKNNDNHWKYADREILLSERAWSNDNLMDLVTWDHGSPFWIGKGEGHLFIR